MKSRGADTIGWDGWGRMSGGSFNGSSLSYGFDASGAWRSRTSGAKTTRYLLGDDFETDGTGTLTASYTPGPAGNLAQYSGPPTAGTSVSFLYYDDHGNLVAEANGAGSRTAAHTYDPFGAPLDSQPANSTVHRFTGRWNKQYDTSSQLIQMGARPYDPTLGRFLAVDPVEGGSLNNYDYAGQDPIDGYDLDGTCWTGFCWAKHAARKLWKDKAAIAQDVAITVVAVAAGTLATAACGGNVTCGVIVGIGVRGAVSAGLHAARGASARSSVASGVLDAVLGGGELSIAAKSGGRLSMEFGLKAAGAKMRGETITAVRSFGGGYILRGPGGRFVGRIHCMFC